MKFSRQFPLAYCLLPNKTQETYEWTFNLLKQKCAELHIEFNLTSVMSDFELAIIQAVQLTFPLTTPKGCYFHFCQCLTRKVQTLGLQVRYINDPDVRIFIRIVSHKPCMFKVCGKVGYSRLFWGFCFHCLPSKTHITYWDECQCCSLPPSLWNVFDAETTNNHLEGWDSS